MKTFTKLSNASPKDGEQDSTKENGKKSVKPCNFGGGLDHRRKPNRLCPSYNGGGGKAKTNVITIQTDNCMVINDVTKLISNKS